MLIGYNTNGFANHRLLDAIEVLADIGYESVAITVDHHALDPYSANFTDELLRVCDCLRQFNMRSVVETGARFLLDPQVKHEPTLLTADAAARSRRIDFLRHTVEIAAALESDCVSLWSGILRDDIEQEAAIERLVQGLMPVIDHAEELGVTIGFEPEPGMLIDTMDSFSQLRDRITSDKFQLTLDVGHLHCLRETPIEDHVKRWHDHIVNVHIEDMRAGVHEHLMFGEGEMEFLPILRALRTTEYAGGLHVELSRHSHDAPNAARKAFEFLQAIRQQLIV